MNEIDDFLSFIFENIEDDRFEVTKGMSDGYRHYAIGIHIEDGNRPINTQNIYSYNNIAVKIDTQNNCIILTVNMDEVLIENKELTEKWANACEEYLASKIDSKVNILISNALGKSDLLREYKIKRIL